MAEKECCFSGWKKKFFSYDWDSFSLFIILSFGILQATRWIILPQFMDIYYHLLTAWGFLQSGGYSGWDFWQYAPAGRVHIYPPFLHICLALFIKLGVERVILAKILEMAMPVLFLLITWIFVRRNYSRRLAFLVVILAVSSFSFYMSLINHVPATLAMIFGILAFDQILRGRSIRAIVLFVLSFYTHIGISWFLFLSTVFYALFNIESRKRCLYIAGCSFLLAFPVIFKQSANIGHIRNLGINLNEINLLQFKIIEYLLAFFGLIAVFKSGGKYKLFLGFFISSLIFLSYPYRFFSCEGYFSIVFLAAVALDNLYERNRSNRFFKKGFAGFLLFIFLFSPTIIGNNSVIKEDNEAGGIYKLRFAHSAFMGMIFPLDEKKGFSNSIWFPDQYLSAAGVIKENSEKDDILYCTDNVLGVCLASLSERASANGLFPEIKVSKPFDPFLVSKLIIVTKDKDARWIREIADSYNLSYLGENKIFIFFKNPLASGKIAVKKTTFPFSLIMPIGILLIIIFLGNPARIVHR